MDELTLVREFRAEAPAPGHEELAAGRRRLAQATAGKRARGGRLRMDRRLAIAAAAVFVTAAALIGTQLAGGGMSTDVPASAPPRALPGTAEEVLERIAGDLDRMPGPGTPEPRAGQFVYLRWYIPPPLGDEDSPWQEYWMPYGDPELEDPDNPDDARSNREEYEFLAGLPADPKRALGEMREFYQGPKGEKPGPRALRDYTMLSLVLDAYPTSPGTLAKVYRAVAEIPGIQVRGHTVEDGVGRQAIALSVRGQDPAGDDDVREELLIDAGTYTFVGTREVEKDGDDVYYSTRVEIALVDEKGDRP